MRRLKSFIFRPSGGAPAATSGQTRQSGVELDAQLGADVLFNQLRAGQQAQPQAQLLRMLAVGDAVDSVALLSFSRASRSKLFSTLVYSSFFIYYIFHS